MPVAVSRCAGDAENASRLNDGQAGKVAELDHLRLGRVFASELGESLVEVEEILRGRLIRYVKTFDIPAATTAAMLLGSLPTGVLDQDPAHGFGGRGEEVAATVPAGVLPT